MSARFAVEGRPVYWSRLILSVGLCGALFLPVAWTAERPRNSGPSSTSETPASEVADQGTEGSSETATPKLQAAPDLEKGGTSTSGMETISDLPGSPFSAYPTL